MEKSTVLIFSNPEGVAYLIAHFQSLKTSMNNTIVAHVSVPNARVTLLLEASSLWIAPPNKYHVGFLTGVTAYQTNARN